jgi:AhpD family alkylhydroperoxidase
MTTPDANAPGRACCAGKPIWTLRALAGVLPDLPRHLRRVAPTLIGRPISNALRERIMLAVAAENQCRYCQIAHSVMGEAVGESPERVATILAGLDEGLEDREALALAFARDLARRGFASRDEALWARLGERFSDEERAAIESTAHAMNFANRFGNTFDAALDRARGEPGAAADASLVDLAVVSGVFVGAAAVVAPAVGALKLAVALRGR